MTQLIDMLRVSFDQYRSALEAGNGAWALLVRQLLAETLWTKI
jgi:hypothetical protein